MSNWKYIQITVMIDAGVSSGIVSTASGDIGLTSPLWNSVEGARGIWKIILTIGTNAIRCKQALRMNNSGLTNPAVTEMTSSDDIYSYILSVIGIIK